MSALKGLDTVLQNENVTSFLCSNSCRSCSILHSDEELFTVFVNNTIKIYSGDTVVFEYNFEEDNVADLHCIPYTRVCLRTKNKVSMIFNIKERRDGGK